MNQARALAIVGALLSGASFSAGGVAGRMTAPEPAPSPAEVRFVPAPAWAVPLIEPGPAVAIEAEAPPEPPESRAPPAITPPADVKPVPPANVEARPKVKPKPAPPRPRTAPPRKPMPSCAVIKREYERMSFTERMAAYSRADAEQIAHGRRCLGM